MNCPKCGLQNPDGASFCMRCGKELVSEHSGSQGSVLYCYKHPKEETQLSCGRCDRPLCTKCVVLGPAGPRCRDCAKLAIPLRPGAVVHEAKMGVSRLFRGGPWTIYIWILLLSTLGAFGRGCVMSNNQRRGPQQVEVPQDRERQSDPVE